MSDFLDSYSMVIRLLFLVARVPYVLCTQSLEDLSFAVLRGKINLLGDLLTNDVCNAKSSRQCRNTCKLLLGVFTFFFILQQKLYWLENFAVDSLKIN